MGETDNSLKVGRHVGTWGNGNYIASISENGTVTIMTVYDNANQKATVKISHSEWDRLVAWVEWQRKKNI